jgi:N-acyl-D-amino-acid deacylase
VSQRAGPLDLVLRGGILVDGTGAPGRRADVGVLGDRIAAVGDLDAGAASQVLDATGLVVAPGFIDVHVHTELERLGGEDALSGMRQGVTTELTSPDGFSWAPLSPPRSGEVREYLQVFYGRPDLAFEWPTVESYLREFERPLPGNLVPQAPHLAIKVAAMGWETRAATAEELAVMVRLLEEWLEAGAVGMAAGLEYQPAASSSTVEELVALCRVVARHGGVYAPHQRGYLAHAGRGCRESFRIARESGAALHISHLAVTEQAEELLDQAVAEDLDVSFDMYPYAASCTHLLMMLPVWAQAGGHDAAMERLLAPSDRLLDETDERLGERGRVTLAMVEGEPELEGRTLDELAAAAGSQPARFMVELLRGHGGRALGVYHWPESMDGRTVLGRTLAHPLFMGGSDGIVRGSRPHPRAFGSFARIVGDHVRDGTLGLEEAVHKVTGRPGRRFSIGQRGEIREGWAADLVAFDAERLADRATYADGRRAPEGMVHVVVNGRPVLQGGAATGARPGRLLRR